MNNRNHEDIDNEILDLANGEAGIWTSHPRFPMGDWRYEVANCDTLLGYDGWLYNKLANEEINDIEPV